MTSWHAQNHFLPVGLKFNLASVKNNHNYEKEYFECVLKCMVRNIPGRATTPDTTVYRQQTYMHAVILTENDKTYGRSDG